MRKPPDLPPGFPAVRSARPMGGGDVAEVWDVELADGRRVVAKTGGGDPELEAEGLAALAEAGAPTPAVLGLNGQVLVMTYVTGAADWDRLGRALARVHRRTSARFGWHRDNLIGPLAQDNTPTSHWPTFFIDHRLAPWLPSLPATLRSRLTRAMSSLLPDLLDHDVSPSLVHGDLWGGNIVGGCCFIDPAVHFADRELDLAMLDLFGSIPAPMQAGYDDIWPLDRGWEQRRPALQLYHLLIHVALFGSAYHSAVAARLDAIGA
ncbi:MAG: fructosamine kinase family protein [Gammaproteobacteria bacterium]|nr:fructosamine kinase family protein [Gammaproteobacteria bacterium]